MCVGNKVRTVLSYSYCREGDANDLQFCFTVGLMKIVLVAAIGDNLVIGRDGQLPWHLKSDLQHFRKLTLNRPLIMGRKTHESIGKLLDGRTNIVLSRDFRLVAHGAVLATSLDASLSFARADAAKRGVDEIMVIGGERHLRRHNADGRPPGNHACACFARGRRDVPANRRRNLAGSIT